MSGGLVVPAEVARRITSGAITQVRVPAKDQRCRYKIGNDYAVVPHKVWTELGEVNGETVEFQRRRLLYPTGDDPPLLRVTIEDRRADTLGSLTQRDAIAEGFPTTDEYLAAWKRHRGSTAPERPVWVLTVRPADPVRLLAAGGGYTGSRIMAVDDLEAVDEATQRRITERKGMESAQWQAVDDARREQRALDARLREAMMAADAQGLDVRRQIASIRQRIQSLESIIRRAA